MELFVHASFLEGDVGRHVIIEGRGCDAGQWGDASSPSGGVTAAVVSCCGLVKVTSLLHHSFAPFVLDLDPLGALGGHGTAPLVEFQVIVLVFCHNLHLLLR